MAAQADVRIVDATAFLQRDAEGGGPYRIESGRATYEAGHIPGAVFADIPADFSDPDAPHALTVPSPQAFAEAVQDLGISNAHQVVVYAQGAPPWATRFWWLLRYFGHQRVSVLDGGLTAWVADNRPLETGSRSYPRSAFAAHPDRSLLARLQEVREVVDGGGEQLVNALSPSAFRGLEPSAYARPGRIPGSINVPFSTLLDPVTLRFHAPDEMRRVLEDAGVAFDRPVTTYCGGGISATVPLFALVVTGHPQARLYDGSLTEWSADPDLPMVTG